MNLAWVDVTGDLNDMLFRMQIVGELPIGYAGAASIYSEELTKSRDFEDAVVLNLFAMSKQTEPLLLEPFNIEIATNSYFSVQAAMDSAYDTMQSQLAVYLNTSLSAACSSIDGQIFNQLACRSPSRLIQLLNGLYDL